MKKYFQKKQLVFVLGMAMTILFAGCGKNAGVSAEPSSKPL